MSDYKDPFSSRAEEIARQAILRADSLGMEHYGPAPAPLDEKRDMFQEAIEELLDSIYYLTRQVAKLEDMREREREYASRGPRVQGRGRRSARGFEESFAYLDLPVIIDGIARTRGAFWGRHGSAGARGRHNPPRGSVEGNLMPPYSPEMKVDILGRIGNMQVPVQHALNPVFEAVVNSIHATEKRFGDAVSTKGSIEVQVHRVVQGALELGGPGRTPIPDVTGFSIIDNGEGFTDPNLRAFETADTTAKVELGGKGVGRFTWLVVFNRASVTSTFEAGDGKERRRAFIFRPTSSAIDEFDEREMMDASELETRVELQGVRSRYSDELRKSAEVIADRLFEHCFNYFVIGRCPRIRLVDDAPDAPASIDINAKVGDINISEPLPLSVGRHTLQARHVQQRHRFGRKHTAHLCAHQRAVTQIPLSEISDLGSEPIKGTDGQVVVHHVFVAGSALDEAVDASRTHLNLPDGKPLLERAGALDLKTLREELGKHVNEHLGEMLNAEREENFEKIQLHVRTEQPEYRHLLERVPAQLRHVRYTENRKQLDEALYRVKQGWEAEVRRRQADVEARLSASDADPDQFAEELARVIAEVNDAGQADLVRYVAQRRAVLNLLGRLISKVQGPALEEHIHRVVFPLKKTGDDVAFGDHNLWLVDDTLSFYEYLSSDVPFSKNEAAPVASRRRPDILAFKTGEPYQHISIVEFKRPDRDDENPVQQLVEYAQLLRKGGALDANYVTLPGIDRSVRIDAYALVTLTPKLQETLEVSPGDLHKVENEWRWYGHVTNLNTTIEVLDYRAFIRRAEQRNRAFFTKLGLP